MAAGNVRPGELERAQENLKGRMLLSLESTSNRMSRLGKSLITDTELLSLDELVARGRGGHGRRRGRDRGRPAPARPALGRRNRPVRGAVPRGDRARQSGSRRARSGVKVILFGRGGKVGSVLGPALEAAGHELVESTTRCGRGRRLHPARGSRGERPSRARGRRPGRRRDDRLRPGARGGAGARARAAASSTRRTSRSGRC